jgi:hypothetical protein
MSIGKREILASCFMTVALLAWPGSGLAGPSISRGEQFISGSEDSCIAKAQSGLVQSGWTGVYVGGRYVTANKGAFSAYITCNASAGGGIVVNIFVASSLVPDNIPGDGNPGDTQAGAQRVALQAVMNR